MAPGAELSLRRPELTECRAPFARSAGELCLHLGNRGVRQRGAVGEHERRYGLVAAVSSRDDLGRIGVLLDVDQVELDPLTLQLPLQAVAVTTPRSGVERELCRHSCPL